MNERQRVLWLWLHLLLGPCHSRVRPLLERYGSPEGLYEQRREDDFAKTLSKWQQDNMKTNPPEHCAELLRQWEQCGFTFLPYEDERYPERLRQTHFAPAGLFVTGDPSRLDAAFAVAGVGSRVTTAYGREAVKLLCGPLAKAGVTLVSGMAYGIDSEVHNAALEAGAPTIAVMGTAIDKTYPSRHKGLRAAIERTGAVVSEYPPGTAGDRFMFPQRNRIVSGLASAVVVFEAARRSGTMITANWALEDGREVFAVPGSIFSEHSEGTNRLIRQGATPALSADDILASLGVELYGTQLALGDFAGDGGSKPKLDAKGSAIYDALAGGERTSDELLERTKLAPHELFAALTILEIDGVIESCAGSRYRIK